MRPIVLFLTVWLPVSAGAMELGSIPTPATRMQRGTTCTFVPGQPPRCSDGRAIATARASECMERVGDTWTTRPENTACVDDDGLQVWQGFTNYWVNSSTPSAWPSTGVVKTGRTLAVTDTSGRVFTTATPSAGIWTATCEMKPAGTNTPRFRIYQEGGGGGGYCNFTLEDEVFRRYSCSYAITGTPTQVAAHLHITTPPGVAGSIEVDQCQFTKTDFPMPRHDCGATACSRDADKHTLPTTGFPTTKGEVRITYQLGQACPAGSSCFIFDGRGAGDTANPPQFFINTSGVIHFAGWGLATVALGAAPAVGVDDSLVLRRIASGEVVIVRNGVEVFRGARSPFAWGADARLGYRFADLAGFLHLSGSLSRLSWSAR